MKLGNLAIVSAYTICYEASRAGQPLEFGSATEHLLTPGDFAIVLSKERTVRFASGEIGGVDITLVLCLCKFGLVSLNPHSIMILPSDDFELFRS